MGSSTILVLGHFCWDGLESDAGSLKYEPGGIAYSLFALSSVMETGDRMIPVFPVEKDSYQTVLQELARLPHADPSGIYPSEEKNDRVRVIYRPDEDPGYESIHSSEQPINLNHLPETEPDAVYINFQTGFDLKIQDLAALRSRYPKAFIHLDLHVRTDRLFASFKNNPAGLQLELKQVFGFVDSVQVNQRELQMLFLGSGTTEKGLLKMAFFEGQVRFFLITKGSRGVVAWEKVLTTIHSHILRPEQVVENGYAVGCGDILGSVYTHQMIRTQSLKKSLSTAMRLAGQAAKKQGFSGKADYLLVNGAFR
ncbi:MAG: PfkB family carbohydrate kinase [Bacteroidetes bacterium]|nr:PfkB family carbohydrate kinase [Bacteroidota bacterium]